MASDGARISLEELKAVVTIKGWRKEEVVLKATLQEHHEEA